MRYTIGAALAGIIFGISVLWAPTDEEKKSEGDGWSRDVRLLFEGETGVLPEAGEIGEAIEVPALSEKYQNDRYRFSLYYPFGFQVGEFKETDDYTTIVIQNIEKRLGIQIYISSPEENIILSKSRIEQDIPDMTVEDPQPLQIGNSDNGIAFLSKNPSFGESREVWFMFKGNLYQVSTYISLDPLLQAILNTWEFY